MRPWPASRAPTQLIQDNLLGEQEVTPDQLIKCAENSGMRAKAVKLDWDGLAHLKKALPAIVRLRNGSSMVLLRSRAIEEHPRDTA